MREREKTFERKVPFPAKQQMEGLPTEIAAEDRSLTETSAKRRVPLTVLVKDQWTRTEFSDSNSFSREGGLECGTVLFNTVAHLKRRQVLEGLDGLALHSFFSYRSSFCPRYGFIEHMCRHTDMPNGNNNLVCLSLPLHFISTRPLQ